MGVLKVDKITEDGNPVNFVASILPSKITNLNYLTFPQIIPNFLFKLIV